MFTKPFVRPLPFRRSDARLLAALGFECEHVEAHWEDVGGPESGPKLDGRPEHDVWARTVGTLSGGKIEEYVVVCDGEVVDFGAMPVFEDVPF